MSGYQQANAPYQIPPQVLQALMQHLQQQQQMQNAAARAPVQTGAVGGPLPAATPPTMPGTQPQQGQTPMAGTQPLNITGGGTPIVTTAGVQGNVPFGGQGIPAPQPKAFGGLSSKGGPGGQNAHGGANPFQINPNLHPPGSGLGSDQLKMDNLGNYYYGSDPSATSEQTIKNAGQLLQSLPISSM